MQYNIRFLKSGLVKVEFPNGKIIDFEEMGSVMLDKFLVSFCIYDYEDFEPAKVKLDIEDGILYFDDFTAVENNEFMITKNFVISATKLNKRNCLNHL
jgi:hypothetical protein